MMDGRARRPAPLSYSAERRRRLTRENSTRPTLGSSQATPSNLKLQQPARQGRPNERLEEPREAAGRGARLAAHKISTSPSEAMQTSAHSRAAQRGRPPRPSLLAPLPLALALPLVPLVLLVLLPLLSVGEQQPDEQAHRDELELLAKPFDYHASMPVITKRELANAIKQASAQVRTLRESLDSAAALSVSNTNDPNDNALGWLASSVFHKAALEADVLNQTNQALISEEATRILAKQYRLNRLQTLRGLPLISVDQTPLGRLCQRGSRSFACPTGAYRSLSGHCNNVQNPDWGAARTALARYAPANYADNIGQPARISRKALGRSAVSAGQQPMPSARAVSSAIYEATGGPQTGSHMTTLMSFFGQFVFHDLAYVSQYSMGSERSASIACCSPKSGQMHPECMPVELEDAQTNERFCLHYVRSTPAIRAGCNLGPRDQLNLVSSFLDASTLYGSSEEQSERLRAFSGGRLRSQRSAVGQQALELLPQIKLRGSSAANGSADGLDAVWSAAAQDCNRMADMRVSRPSASRTQEDAASSSRCFQSGDDRVNENIGLTLMHTIWLREHNQIADKLSQINKHWRDERVFEEARRIVVAQLQHITYTEFLPSIIGDESMQKFNLTTLSQGYSQSYDPNVNAAVSNELASAVFPFILSTIPSSLERYSDRLEMLGTTSLADTFMDGSDLFRQNRFAQYLMGMMSQSAMEPALALMPMALEMTASMGRARRQTNQNDSLAMPTSAPQLDLLALTLQQARDHGLKSYLYWRQACSLRPQIRNWSDLALVMPSNVVERLRLVYANVHQLDLYLALLETAQPGASIGPTFACLLARQFHQLKHGDRYWYENDLPDSSFSLAQLEQIRQSSLAKVLCRNSQASIQFVQPSPMLTSDPFLNAYQYCSNKAMGQLDLSKWRQPVTSAQQLADDGHSDGRALRSRRLIESNAQLIARSLHRAKRELEQYADEERERLRKHRARAAPSGAHSARAGYRHLPRLKRQTLKLNNQSLIFELATNGVVRSLLHQGKDRERAQSIQADIRDFLHSLESIQLDQLLENSADANRLDQFIQSAGTTFLTAEQRTRLLQAGDPTLTLDQDLAGLQPTDTIQRSNSVSVNCQDDQLTFPCDHTSPFRTITGWCNNLQNPKFGQSFTQHDRILPNAYEDGLSQPRALSVALVAQSASGERQPLPSARLVSTVMHEDQTRAHVRYSLALMQFGQFGVDHDLTRTPFSVALDGSLLDCSSCDSRKLVHRDCLPIEIPDDDRHFHSARAHELTGNNRKCLHFVRSLNGQTGLGPRQQINALTAYVDASNIYGSDNCEAKSLRAFTQGRLNSSAYPSQAGQQQPKEIMPLTRANPECATPSGLCFHAGDQRASEQPGLTSFHTIFLRFHNSIVRELANVNRHWNDEKLYQHGRRIVGAVMQRITYGEFAPRLLGLDYMSKFDLMLKQVGYQDRDHYDEGCSANILTEFAAAAFRMGHSLIKGTFPLLNKQYKPAPKGLQLRKAFFNSQRILSEPQLIDSILRGIVSTPIETLDNAISEELTNHLFERPKEPFSGMDLIALNIQRARDHGIGAYNLYRVKCNLTRARSFDDLSGEIPQKLITRLSALYASVDDIDLFSGGMSELPVHGGIIGPTLGCIIGMQFSRLKRCDRFWHETSDPWLRFSAAQLAEIRKITLATIICQESDEIDAIQRNAMDMSDPFLNPRVPCSSLPSKDMSAWRENTKSCLVNKVKIEMGHSKRVNPCKSCTCTAEGPICRTAKINCLQATRQSNQLTTIMADKSCLVQCAWLLDMQPITA